MLNASVTAPKNWGKRIKQGFSSALNESVTQATERIKLKGRQDIRGSWPRMAPRMMNAWTAVADIAKGESLNPTAKAYHKANYSGIFEEGRSTTITPKASRLLWIPIPNSPAAKLRKGGAGNVTRMTPAAVSFQLGLPLIYVHRPGSTPILAVKNVRATKTGVFRKVSGNRTRMANKKERFLTPLFFGVPAVTIVGRWKVRSIAVAEWGKLNSLVKSKMK